MTSPRIIPELWHQTTLRGGILAHLTGLRTADHGPLTEGDIVRLNGEGPRLRVTYGPYTDFSSNFAGIGWYLAYIDQYAGDAHSSIDDWAEEAMHVVDQSPPRAPAEVLHGPSGRANPLLIQDGCYQFAPGICEGSRIVVRDCPGPVEGTLCFGFYSGRGYGPRHASGFVWFVETMAGERRPIACASNVSWLA